MKRVIVFYISDFGGHSKAAENIKEAFLAKYPDVEVLSINGFGYFYPYWEKIVDSIYTTVIKHIPRLWGRLYDRRGVLDSLRPYRGLANRLAFSKIMRLIKDFNPDAIVATQAFPCGLAADLKKSFNLKIPLIAVVTDYHPHRFWIHSCIDKYVVASSQAKDILIKEGVQDYKIEILGIPISLKFLNSSPTEKYCSQLGLSPNLNTVLIMGGGLGIGPIKKIAQYLDVLSGNFQIIVVCGRNKTLYNWFERNLDKFKKPIFCFGYIDFIHKLMGFCDIIITKAGGITVSESLAKGLAIIIANPIPGQEERNVNYLLSRGAVVKADTAQDIKEAVQMFLRDKQRMDYFKQRAKDCSFMNSSLKITDLIWEQINK